MAEKKITIAGIEFQMDPMTSTGYQLAGIKNSLQIGKDLREAKAEEESALIDAAKALAKGARTRTLANAVCAAAGDTLDHLDGLLASTTADLDPNVYDITAISGAVIRQAVGISLADLGINPDDYKLPQPTTTPAKQTK